MKLLQLFFILFLVLNSLIFNSGSAFEIAKTNKKSKEPSLENKTTEEKQELVKKAPINESEYQSILIGSLLDKPHDFLEKKIKFRGKFSSFTTLALDYKPAMRSSKDYISVCIFRSDSKIPLSELKMAYPVKEAKEDLVIRELEEGDLLEFYGKVFSDALDEPWIDLISIKKLESAPKKAKDTIKEEKSQNKSPEDKNPANKALKKKRTKE